MQIVDQLNSLDQIDSVSLVSKEKLNLIKVCDDLARDEDSREDENENEFDMAFSCPRRVNELLQLVVKQFLKLDHVPP